MDAHLKRELDRFESDRKSGASALLETAIGILVHARGEGSEALADGGRALVTAHPTMASIWNAVGFVLESADDFDTFVERAARAARGLARVVTGAFPALPEQGGVLRIVTCSASGRWKSASRLWRGIGKLPSPVRRGGLSSKDGRWQIASRPRESEWISIQMQLSTSRWTERIRSWWGLINKVGTRQLACAAVSDGTPVYVAASRDKFTHPLLAERIPGC